MSVDFRLRGVVEFPYKRMVHAGGGGFMKYRKEIVKMVKQIKDIRSLKMIYGFVKALKEKDGDRQ